MVTGPDNCSLVSLLVVHFWCLAIHLYFSYLVVYACIIDVIYMYQITKNITRKHLETYHTDFGCLWWRSSILFSVGCCGWRSAVLSRFRAILLQEQKRYLEAVESYLLAIQCRPRLTSKYTVVYTLVWILHVFNRKIALSHHSDDVRNLKCSRPPRTKKKSHQEINICECSL